MLSLIDAGFALAEALLILTLVRYLRPHLFITLHAVVFWAVIVVFNGVSTWTLDARYDTTTYLLVHTLVLFYLVVVLASGVLLKRSVIGAIESIPNRAINVCVGLWLAFRLYLLSKYGVASFNLLAFREDVGASYWEAALISMLWYLAFGALLAFVVKAAIRPRILFTLQVLPAVAVLIFAVLFNEVAGARRLLFVLLALGGLVAIYHHGFRWKPLFLSVIACIPLVAAAEYYQRIRTNIVDEQVVEAIQDGNWITALRQYIGGEQSSSTLENLQERFSPFKVLYVITEQQLDRGTTTNGRLIAQSFENVAPALLAPNKEVRNADEQLAEAFDALPRTDLPSGTLAMLQSDMHFLAYLISPLFITFLIWAYSRLMLTDSPTLRIAFLGLAIGAAQSIEHLMDSLLVSARDAIVLVAFIWIARSMHVVLRYTAKQPSL